MKLFNRILALGLLGLMVSCNSVGSIKGKSNSGGVISGSTAEKVYVAPGEHDSHYAFLSGGFSGQLSVYGLPSGRLFRVIPVFSQDPEKGYGYSEETKPMLNTSFGFVPWGDSHHPDISQTEGTVDGRWVFINENNTPRVARISLKTFETEEILEIPNSAGNHSSTSITENSEYIVCGTRFSVPFPQRDMPISDMKGNFKGAISFVSIDQEHGHMEIAFQLKMPGFSYDIAHPGRGVSHGWMFFSTYNTEEVSTLMEVNASQNDKDFIAAINWKKIEEYIANGVGSMQPAKYAHNLWDDDKHLAVSTMKKEVLVIDPKDVPGAIFFLPTAKSPHGCDIDPTGEYIIGNGKLAASMTVHSFSKMKQAIADKAFDGDAYGIPIIKFEAVNYGMLNQPGLGPLHTEFDTRGNGYTTFFISSEVVKWNIKDLEVIDRHPVYYSVGHLMIPGGNSRTPDDKYMVAMNKITKDRYLPTGPEVCQSAQLFDISGEKMELLLDFPTIGEPHYAAGIAADKIAPHTTKIFRLEDNIHPYGVQSESETNVFRKGNEVHITMTMIRSHFAPDNIEGVQVGDKVFFHVTNLEQDYDVPHGISMIGANTSELLIMPGRTATFTWEPKQVGVWPFYCTDFCSALHQEMQGYVRVSPKGSNVPISFTIDGEKPGSE